MSELINKKFRNILIVDDDEDDCALISETLGEIDTSINRVALTDSKAVVSYLADSDLLPDIIFLDLYMPRMSGIELLKVLKADPDFSQIPIVICSDSKMANEMDECKLLGASYFIMKPASFLLIKYEIRKALKAIAETLVA